MQEPPVSHQTTAEVETAGESDHVKRWKSTGFAGLLQFANSRLTSEEQRPLWPVVQQIRKKWSRTTLPNRLMQKRETASSGKTPLAESADFLPPQGRKKRDKNSTNSDTADSERQKKLEERARSDESASNWNSRN